jgi:hypothetical protein
LQDHHLLSLYKIEIEGDLMMVGTNGKARSWEEKIDEMLLRETTDLPWRRSFTDTKSLPRSSKGGV